MLPVGLVIPFDFLLIELHPQARRVADFDLTGDDLDRLTDNVVSDHVLVGLVGQHRQLPTRITTGS